MRYDGAGTMPALLSEDDARNLIVKAVMASNRPLTNEEIDVVCKWADEKLLGVSLLRALQRGELRLTWPESPITSLADFDERVGLAPSGE